ncbi:IS66 Orf2 like protein [Aeoliella mucimassa]|uniref:IS66 Orf2 like protein n=1 Tax=Aeoliella mucimassa TaxID=2527972 RepID=A0A518AIR1_9BACT|nr:IS66 family insertion sequence element accessory protein TnpB [Aeoliella mucimassa]QDU54628.1 IS66 Orf2 like protein [Aeoliella mucimassa]
MIAADLQNVQVWVATTPVDMRKSFDGLAEVVRSFLGHDPLSGSLFVFRNKGRPPGKSALVGPRRIGDLLQATGAWRVSVPTHGQARH